MQRHTSTILTLMIGLLLGRLVSLHDVEIMELTGIGMLALCYRSEFLYCLFKLATRPRIYVAASGKHNQAAIPGWLLAGFFLTGMTFGYLVAHSLHLI